MAASVSKVSESCETLQYGTGLLGRNSEGPQGESNIDDLIRAPRLQLFTLV